jgi:hypothetical protein
MTTINETIIIVDEGKAPEMENILCCQACLSYLY